MVNLGLSVRRATPQDQSRIANLIYFEPNVHRHLDWRSPLDWLGSPEYWVAEVHGSIAAALACPPDPKEIAWLRLFARSSLLSLSDAWNGLWQTAIAEFAERPNLSIAAISLQPWFENLLLDSGFELNARVVVLQHSGNIPEIRPFPTEYILRPMANTDLEAVAELDANSFAPLWQNSLGALQHAYTQSGIATVLEYEGEIIAYQISTRSPFGAHLARLAVHPGYQGKGIGYLLVQNLIQQTIRQGVKRVTVNTQSDNSSSLALYEKMGFFLTGEQYPVYTYKR